MKIVLTCIYKAIRDSKYVHQECWQQCYSDLTDLTKQQIQADLENCKLLAAKLCPDNGFPSIHPVLRLYEKVKQSDNPASALQKMVAYACAILDKPLTDVPGTILKRIVKKHVDK